MASKPQKPQPLDAARTMQGSGRDHQELELALSMCIFIFL